MTRTEDWADYLDPGEPDPPLPGDQARGLDRIHAALADEAAWGEPPSRLRAGLLAAATAERAARPAGPVPVPTTPAAPPAAAPPDGARTDGARTGVVVPLRRRSRRLVLAAVTAAAAAAVLVAVLVWPRPATPSIVLAGTALAPRATATAELEPRSAGVAITLHVKGLPPAPAGAYYAAWLHGPSGYVPVGSFHWRKGGIPIDLWSGVGGSAYPDLVVTLQREGQPLAPSAADVVLSGHRAG